MLKGKIHMKKEKNIMLEDIMICDPISKRGKEALKRINSNSSAPSMSFDDFYRHIYVEPYFVNDLEDDNTKNQGQTIFDDFSDYYFTKKSATIGNMKSKKIKYEEYFFL